MKTKIFIVSLFILLAGEVISQTKIDSISIAQKKSFFKMKGFADIYGAFYSVDGIEARLPSLYSRLNIRPTLIFWDVLEVPIEFLYTNDKSEFRQEQNYFGAGLDWGWGKVKYGDFAWNYSDLTWNGQKIRGGGIDINPIQFRAGFAYGIAQRAVNAGADRGAFERFFMVSKIGVGNYKESFFDLIVLKTKDNIHSLKLPEKYFQIISPDGKEVLPIGSRQTLKWITYGYKGRVTIELSRDGGSTFEVIETNYPNAGFYDWIVSGPASKECVLKISADEDPSIFDLSDNLFEISLGGSLIPSELKTNVKNYMANLPRENLVISVKWRSEIIEKKLYWNAEAAGSAYSRDLFSMGLDIDSAQKTSYWGEIFTDDVKEKYDFAFKVAKRILKIFTPRLSSVFDYSYQTDLTLNTNIVNAKVDYKRIGPGFYSLGAPYLMNDIQEIGGNFSIKLKKVDFGGSYQWQKDNLLSQKKYSTFKNVISAFSNFTPMKNYFVNLYGGYFKIDNDTQEDTFKVIYNGLFFNLNQTLSFPKEEYLKGVSLSYSYQNSSNDAFFASTNYNLHSIVAGVNALFFEDLSVLSNIGLTFSSFKPGGNYVYQNYSLGAQYFLFERELSIGALNTFSIAKEATTNRLTFSASYEFSKRDIASANFSMLFFNSAKKEINNFTETIFGLNYRRRFN